MFKRIAVVMPVLDDWPSMVRLIEDMEALRDPASLEIVYVAIDDGSRETFVPAGSSLPADVSLHVVELKANMGHQRALALGLAHVERELDVEAVLLMDSDGEDRPVDAYALLARAERHPGSIVCALRAKRSETFAFRAFYVLYRAIFQTLTGKAIRFGNFSLIPSSRLTNVLYAAGIWNNIAATLLRCRVPIVFHPTDRGNRYFGASKMNFVSLVVHGISVISVFSDVVIARIVIALSVLLSVLVIGVLVTLGIKLEGSTFIPGYATNVILFLANMIITSLFIGFAVVVMLLNTRTLATSLPSTLYDSLVRVVREHGPTRAIGHGRFPEAAE